MNFLKDYFPSYFLWMSLVSLVYALLVSHNPGSFGAMFLATFVISQISCLACIICEGAFYQRVSPWKAFWSHKKRESYRPLGSLVFLPIGLALGYFIVPKVFFILGIDFFAYFPTFSKGPSLRAYGLGLISVFIISYVRYVSLSREREKDLEIKMKSLELENVKTRLLALNLQMNPHFLFNTLHTLMASIKEDSKKAEEILMALSDLLRLILLASQKEFHSLKEELKILFLYTQLEKIRFGDRVSFSFQNLDSEEILQKKFPVLILQPIVENAIKYGLSENQNKIEVRLSQSLDEKFFYLLIENNGEGLDPNKKGNAIGLENCRKRLELMFGQEGKLSLSHSDGWTRVILRVPNKKERES